MSIDALRDQVKANCNISDSKYWGYLSLCSMLGRLRDLYFHEHKLLPWDKVENRVVMDWITTRESAWDDLEDKDYQRLEWEGRDYDPLLADELNEILAKSGYVYGGGIATLNKPVFFLARLERIIRENGFSIYISGEELAHDLTPPFAMHRGGVIHFRIEPYINFLHYKYREMGFGHGGPIVKEAFLSSGFEPDLSAMSDPRGSFLGIVEKTMPLILHHEMGESIIAKSMGERHALWTDLMTHAADKIAELTLRAIKDMAADTAPGGSLEYVIHSGDRTILLFYLSFFDDLRKKLFPDFYTSLRSIAETGNPAFAEIEKIRESLNSTVGNLMDDIMRVGSDPEDKKQDVRDYLRRLTA